LDYYLDFAIEKQEAMAPESPFFFSVAGMSVEENIELLKKIEASNFRGHYGVKSFLPKCTR
jgi:dihydroorotate dehydrogenase (fumarate)